MPLAAYGSLVAFSFHSMFSFGICKFLYFDSTWCEQQYCTLFLQNNSNQNDNINNQYLLLKLIFEIYISNQSLGNNIYLVTQNMFTTLHEILHPILIMYFLIEYHSSFSWYILSFLFWSNVQEFPRFLLFLSIIICLSSFKHKRTTNLVIELLPFWQCRPRFSLNKI